MQRLQVPSTWQHGSQSVQSRHLPGRLCAPVCGAARAHVSHRLPTVSQLKPLASATPTRQKPHPAGRGKWVCRATPEPEQEEGPLDGAGQAVGRWFWGELTLEQRIYTIVAVMALLVLLPRLFLFFVIGLERMFVGSLLAVEEVVVQLIFRLASLGLTIWLGFLALLGIYLFIGPWKRQEETAGGSSSGAGGDASGKQVAPNKK